jgi:DsbC/DsbD-like thiol-disulfide interchange protein
MCVRSRFTRAVFGLGVVVAAASAPLASSAGHGLQVPAPGGAATETRHLTLTTSATPAAVTAARQRVVLNVDVALKPKMHVYAPDQPKDQDYMPIVLTVTPNAAYQLLEKPRYPPSEKLFFAPLKETQHVYSKPFRVTQPIIVTAEVGREPLTITGTVRYQACDDAICYVPQTVAVKWIISTDSRSQKP